MQEFLHFILSGFEAFPAEWVGFPDKADTENSILPFKFLLAEDTIIAAFEHTITVRQP